MKTINCLLFALLLSALAFGQEDADIKILPPADAPDSEIQIIEAPTKSKDKIALPPPPPPPPMPKPPKDAPLPIPPPPNTNQESLEISSDTESGYVEVYFKSDEVQPEIFQVVETMPEFPGGEKAMLEFLYKNLQYPPDARKEGIEGMAVLSFVVTPTGHYTNVKILRNPGSQLGEEAMRVLKMMPKWNPGKQRGQPVPVLYKLPFRFKL